MTDYTNAACRGQDPEVFFAQGGTAERRMADIPRHARRHRGGAGSIPARIDTDAAPCRAMPEQWDAPVADEDWQYEKRRLLIASETCKQQCPVLAACMRYLADWPHPDGVIAGQVWRDGKLLHDGRRTVA